MKFVQLATLLSVLLTCAATLSASAQSTNHHGPTLDAACRIGYTYREVKAVFDALDVIADEIKKNSSELKEKMARLPSSSTGVSEAQSAAKTAHDNAIEVTSKLYWSTKDINSFYSKAMKTSFKDYFYRNENDEFQRMADTCHKDVSEFAQLLRALENLKGNFDNLYAWENDIRQKLEEMRNEVSQKLLSHQERNDEFSSLNSDFKSFITSVTVWLKTVIFHLVPAQKQLSEAQRAAVVAAAAVVNKRVSECKSVIGTNDESQGQSTEEKKCLKLQAKVEKMQQKQGTPTAAPSDARGSPQTSQESGVGATRSAAETSAVNEVSVVSFEDADNELIDLALEDAGKPNALHNGAMSTRSLALTIGIPVGILLIGTVAFILIRRRTQEKKVAVAI
ncbi:hypothetical protein ERJ75_000516800 [Trypanosoma vivax]|nr:hypothetical protein ERJ75_000516800 [Trypanosoma vivax]